MRINFGIQHAPHRSRPVSSQRMQNCYLESTPPGSRSQSVVMGSCGLAVHTTATSGARGMIVVDDQLYAHDVTGLQKVDAAGVTVTLGSRTVGDDVVMAGDGQYIVAVDVSDGSGWVYDSSLGTYAVIADADFPEAAWVGWIDGWFPVIESGTGKFFINTTAYDPSAWNPLDFARAESNPDSLVWGLVERGEIILFGKSSTEFFVNTGNADFPFERAPNGFVEIGIMSAWAASKISGGVFFMGDDGIAYQLAGYTPQRISSHAFEQSVDGYTRECRVLTWVEAGHSMVCYRFPEAAWVYDLTTQLWHQRSTHSANSWGAKFTAHAHDQWYASGNYSGVLRFDPYTYTEDSGNLVALCGSATVEDDMRVVPHDRLELVFDTGHGGTVECRWSDDGGSTWNAWRQATLGTTGRYSTRVAFSPLGNSRARVYQWRISDQVPRRFLYATLNEWG